MNPVALEQTDFDFLVPVRKELLTVEEVCDILRFERATIYNMVLAGELHMHRRPGAEKSHQRITRASLIGFLAASANYEAVHHYENVLGVAMTLTKKRRVELAHKLLQS